MKRLSILAVAAAAVAFAGSCSCDIARGWSAGGMAAH
jgi:hypothetical protein